MHLQILAKKIDKQFEVAVISEGKFARAMTGKNLTDIVFGQLKALLSFDRPEGTEISVTMIIDDTQVTKEPVAGKSDGQ